MAIMAIMAPRVRACISGILILLWRIGRHLRWKALTPTIECHIRRRQFENARHAHFGFQIRGTQFGDRACGMELGFTAGADMPVRRISL